MWTNHSGAAPDAGAPALPFPSPATEGPLPLSSPDGAAGAPASAMAAADAHAAPADAAQAGELHFAVRYRLGEYASFMWQHTRYLIRRRRIGFPLGWYLAVKSTALALLNFVALGRTRRTYDFTIDPHGIVRAAQGGVTLIDWDDVTAVRRYTRGFMFVLKRGTLPIPARCLDGAQRLALQGLVDARRAPAQSNSAGISSERLRSATRAPS